MDVAIGIYGGTGTQARRSVDIVTVVGVVAGTTAKQVQLPQSLLLMLLLAAIILHLCYDRSNSSYSSYSSYGSNGSSSSAQDESDGNDNDNKMQGCL